MFVSVHFHFLVLFIFSSFIFGNEASPSLKLKEKILIFGLPISYSHFEFDCSIGQWLSEDGYEVHFFTPLLADVSPKMICEFATENHFLVVLNYTFGETFKKLNYGVADMVTSGIRRKQHDFFQNVCEALEKNSDFLIEKLSKENFKLGIGECNDNCLMPFFHKIGIQTYILLSNTPLQASRYQHLGISLSPSYVPAVDEAFPSGDELNYFERIWNLYIGFYEKFIYYPLFFELTTTFIEKFFPGQSLTPLDFRKNISLLVANTNLFLDYAKPSSPKIIHIGGEMIKSPKKLSEDIEKIYSIPSDGVVIISFGTLVDTDRATENFKDSVKAVVKAFPNLQFIWKTNGERKDTEFNQYSNLHLVTWIDQQSMLANPKTKIFFTHCGLNSLNEAAVFGVPMITMPIFGDQHYNSALVNKREIGIAISYLTITPDELISTFNKLLSNPKYSENAKLLSQKIKDNPVKGKDTFLKWIEFLSKYGNNYELHLESAGMSMWKYYCLDIILPLIFVVGFTFWFIIKSLLFVIRKIFNLRKVKTQ